MPQCLSTVEKQLHELQKLSGHWTEGKGPITAYLYEFLIFGIKQGWACLFGGL